MILAFAVNLMSMANLGMSMIVCPAYIISEKFDFLTYGQAEYLIATMVFIIFCLVMKRFKISYLLSYLTGILYALFSDLIKILISDFQSKFNDFYEYENRVFFYRDDFIRACGSFVL